MAGDLDSDREHAGSPPESFTCGICLIDGLDTASREARMPCCYTPTSTSKYCLECIRHVCRFPELNVGRCPTCRTYISLLERTNEDEGAWRVVLANRRDPCVACRQMRVIVDPAQRLCEKCSLGLRFLFLYECEQCHRRQRIPHPMFMYQATSDAFSSDTWACHQLCHTQTRWRIIASDARRVPPEHAPASWGTRAAWLQEVRQRRLEEIANRQHQGAKSVCNKTNFWLTWVLAFLIAGNLELYGIRVSVLLLCLGAAVRVAQWHSVSARSIG